MIHESPQLKYNMKNNSYPAKAAAKRSHKFIAEMSGSKTYFTGKPCKNGHLCERYTSCGKCLQCNLEHQRKRKCTN